MRFSILITLVALLLIQSEAAHSKFVCNDNSKKDAKYGICVRKIVEQIDSHDQSLPPLKNDQLLVIAASPMGNGFTCAKLHIAKRPVEARYCCDFPPEQHKVLPHTKKYIDDHCYTRDAKRKPHRG
ncbi:hypothetical protein PGTUg99_031227 [Puccinia graminis f. sp. tritici]|uniref:Uncharacterized protein n=1 Tax=Puccinia graminis f. sp. tritici TaxID=56615 RepID=A0A5B0LW95_PUCGR|nr:hypothetical protein PGTUg99_031227 [Puccinia graminis f. sp. tritici]